MSAYARDYELLASLRFILSDCVCPVESTDRGPRLRAYPPSLSFARMSHTEPFKSLLLKMNSRLLCLRRRAKEGLG